MLELGSGAADDHAALARDIAAAGIDQVFTAGPLMRSLRDAMPDAQRGGHAERAGELAPVVAESVRAGDIVLVKGSAGSQMGAVVAALRAKATETRNAV